MPISILPKSYRYTSGQVIHVSYLFIYGDKCPYTPAVGFIYLMLQAKVIHYLLLNIGLYVGTILSNISLGL